MSYFIPLGFHYSMPPASAMTKLILYFSMSNQLLEDILFLELDEPKRTAETNAGSLGTFRPISQQNANKMEYMLKCARSRFRHVIWTNYLHG
jgi:hypothetical protein